jgi:hypothetical protein
MTFSYFFIFFYKPFYVFDLLFFVSEVVGPRYQCCPDHQCCPPYINVIIIIKKMAIRYSRSVRSSE